MMTSNLIVRVLTTTACNASCSYCYEQGTPVITMTRDTAKQTALFILKQAVHSNGHVSVEWFGGEPLLNGKVIDTICRELHKTGIWFTSSIVTNGLLMDEKITSERLLSWQLRQAQITLDGPAMVHESVKRFPSDAYEHIMQNISALSERKVRIRLRLNYAGNSEDVSQLISDLKDRFSGNNHVSAYISPVYFRMKEYPRELMMEVLRLNYMLIDSGLATEKDLFALRERKNRCFMMTEGGFTIAPDGRLFNCSHNMTDEQCVGSIWNYQKDHPVRRAFLSDKLSDECSHCIMLPYCRGGCRIAEMGLADMIQCHPYKTIPFILKSRPPA